MPYESYIVTAKVHFRERAGQTSNEDQLYHHYNKNICFSVTEQATMAEIFKTIDKYEYEGEVTEVSVSPDRTRYRKSTKAELEQM